VTAETRDAARRGGAAVHRGGAGVRGARDGRARRAADPGRGLAIPTPAHAEA
jgi:hypothetical protein